MDRCDADQEVPARQPDAATKFYIARAIDNGVNEHATRCPFRESRIEDRLRCVEVSYARLIGFLIGSGILGGAAGGLVAKLIK